MKKRWIIILILLVSLAVSSVTYTWFTYVQRKGFVTFISHDIIYTLKIDQVPVTSKLIVDDLVYIDFEKDFVMDESKTLNEIVSIKKVELILGQDAPMVQVELDILGLSQQGLIVVLMLSTEEAFDFHDYVSSIIDSYMTKEAQMDAITSHNQAFLDQINQIILLPGEHLVFDIYILGDYDEASRIGDYQTMTYQLDISLSLTTNLGG